MKLKDIEIGKTYLERSSTYHEGNLLLVIDKIGEPSRSWSVSSKTTRVIAKKMWRWDEKNEWGGSWKYMPNQIEREMTVDEFKQLRLDALDRKKERDAERKHAAKAAKAYVDHLESLGLPNGLDSFGGDVKIYTSEIVKWYDSLKDSQEKS